MLETFFHETEHCRSPVKEQATAFWHSREYAWRLNSASVRFIAVGSENFYNLFFAISNLKILLAMQDISTITNVDPLSLLMLSSFIALGLLGGVIFCANSKIAMPAMQRIKAFVVRLGVRTSCYARLFKWARARDATLYWGCSGAPPIGALGLTI